MTRNRLAKDLDLHKRDWEDLAALDPLWSILVDKDKKHGNWEVGGFFDTGKVTAAEVIEIIESAGVSLKRGSALDFGCGVGRLTFPLAGVFERCIGVDISSAMVSLAREYHHERYPDVSNVSFEALDRHDLTAFPEGSFDLVFSLLVLQHQPAVEAVELWIREMARVLKPGGVLMFQLPTRLGFFSRWQLRSKAYRLLRGPGWLKKPLYLGGLHPMRMLAVPETYVTQILRDSGCMVANIIPDGSAGPGNESRLYVVTRGRG